MGKNIFIENVNQSCDIKRGISKFCCFWLFFSSSKFIMRNSKPMKKFIVDRQDQSNSPRNWIHSKIKSKMPIEKFKFIGLIKFKKTLEPMTDRINGSKIGSCQLNIKYTLLHVIRIFLCNFDFIRITRIIVLACSMGQFLRFISFHQNP